MCVCISTSSLSYSFTGKATHAYNIVIYTICVCVRRAGNSLPRPLRDAPGSAPLMKKRDTSPSGPCQPCIKVGD